MATTHRAVEIVSRAGRSPKSRGSSLRHKARSQHDVMKESEQNLQTLLEDFEEGRLNAFGILFYTGDSQSVHYGIVPNQPGNTDMLRKVTEIRDMQEKLTVKHFEIDQRCALFHVCILRNALTV